MAEATATSFVQPDMTAEITALVGMFAITEGIVTRLAVHQRQGADLDNVATVRREFANVGDVRNVRTGDTPEKVVGPPPHLYADVIGPPAPPPVEGVVQTGHSRQRAPNFLFPFRRAELAIAQLTRAEACVVDEPDHPIALDHLGEEIVQEGRSKRAVDAHRVATLTVGVDYAPIRVCFARLGRHGSRLHPGNDRDLFGPRCRGDFAEQVTSGGKVAGFDVQGSGLDTWRSQTRRSR